MKFIFIIVSLFIFSIYALNTRDVLSEELALEIEYLGSCKEFYQKVLPSIWVNRHTPCLPIQLNVTNNPDNNDLNTDLFCTNSDERRSIIHFAEIYDTVQTIKEPNFIVSLISSAPFRVLTRKTTVNRRPNCFVTNDYCNADNAIVNDCRTNEVTYRRRHAVNKRPGDRFDGDRRPGFDGDRFNDRRPGFDGRPGDRFNDRRPGFDGRPGDRFDGDRFDHGGRSVRNLPGDKNDGDHFHYSEQRRRGWIVNHDRIYIVSNQQVTNDCKTSITECCNYVTPALFGGICNNYAPVTLLDFPKEKHHKKPHNDKHRPNRPEGNRYDRPDGNRFDGNRFDRPDGNRFDRPDGNRFDGNRFDRPVDNRPERPRDEQRRPSSESSRVVEPIRSDVAPFRTESDVVAPSVQTQRAPASKVKIVAKPKKAPAQKVKVVVVQQPQVVEEVEEREEREEPEQQEQQEQEQQEEAEETNEEEENKK